MHSMWSAAVVVSSPARSKCAHCACVSQSKCKAKQTADDVMSLECHSVGRQLCVLLRILLNEVPFMHQSVLHLSSPNLVENYHNFMFYDYFVSTQQHFESRLFWKNSEKLRKHAKLKSYVWIWLINFRRSSCIWLQNR